MTLQITCNRWVESLLTVKLRLYNGYRPVVIVCFPLILLWSGSLGC
jgi:hypothetical protein